MKYLWLGLLLTPALASAWSIGIYDSEADQTKATVVFTCGKKIFRLNMEKSELELKYPAVESWILDMKKNCKEQ